MAEINGLLNRRTSLKMYRGFESLPHRRGFDQSRPFLFDKNIMNVVKDVPPIGGSNPSLTAGVSEKDLI